MPDDPAHPTAASATTPATTAGRRSFPSDARLDAAIALHERGGVAAAQAEYEDILRSEPDNGVALHMLGVAAAQGGRAEEGIVHMRAALRHEPRNAAFHYNLGKAYEALGRMQEALACHEAALDCRPAFLDALLHRGIALQALGRPQEAVQAYGRVIALQPAHAEAHCRLGTVLGVLGQAGEALASLDRALALAPGYAEAHFCRGIALQALDRDPEAVASYDSALALNPQHAKAHSNRGVALQALGRADEALESFDRALACQPGLVDALWNKALTLLVKGELAQAWPLYEYRWKASATRMAARTFPQPLWLGGESPRGRTVLVHAEQGMGDTLQFCRYVPRLAALGAQVVLEAPAPLLGLLRTLPGVSHLVQKGAPLPAFDLHCPLLSLPLAFGTTLQSIPGECAYLRSDPAQVAEWAVQLGPKRRLRVGLTWSGNPGYGNDRDRSLPLAQLLAHLPPGIDYVSLQREVRASDRDALLAHPELRHFGDALGDFAKTAALCELMDAVVSVDTSTAHLAGALGRPLKVLLSVNPNWRWMLARPDSPWYPSATLYRQARRGAWDAVLEALGRDLAALRA